MKTIRIIGTTAALLLAGGMIAGGLQAQGQAKGHDKQQAKQDQQQAKQQAKQVQQQAKQQQVVARQVQQQRIVEQRQREIQYRQVLTTQVRTAQQRTAQLQQQKRAAQNAAQQQYLVNLRQQQQRLQAARDYARDPAFSARPAYLYRRAGTQYQTTQYGADVLRQAVNYGYQQGVQFGQADRRDGQRSDYQNAYAYQDANYGYDARYVSQTDYNYYFREGFRRGYQDGYGSSQQYGTVSNGSPSILSSILSSILGLTAIR